MGLYDDRMADLSESRHSSRTAGRRSSAHPGEHPYPSKSSEARKRDPMEVQSLLFSRDAGWTVDKAKQWAKEHGYKYGKVDVTEQYIRIRQFSPKGLKVKRTITLGRGIRAVVAREETMAGTQVAARRRPRKKKKASAPRKRSTRRKTKARATTTRRRKRSTMMAAAPRRRRKKAPTRRKSPTRRRTARASGASEAWHGDTAGHRRAAKKGLTPAGHRRKPRRRKKTTRRRRARTSEPSVMAAPRRRKRSTTRRAAPRRRTRAYAAAPRRRSTGMGMAEFGMAVVSAGFGYIAADGLDRFLATYNPASTEAKPKDKFTSEGAGTLANTLNVASPPGFMRIGAGVGLAAVPAVASYYVDGKFIKSSLQGLALGSGVNLFKTLWNNVLMPMLKPKDTSAASLQKSYIARLYPAEIAASINREQKQTAVSSAGAAGALSDAPDKAGVGQPPDVGPFALSRSEYPNAAEALRAAATAAGTAGTPGDDYPTVQNVEGTSRAGDYPTATQAMTAETGRVGAPAAAGNPGQPGVSYEPGPPPLPGPGPQAEPGEDPACGCMNDQYLGLGDKPTDELLYSIATQ